MLRYIYNWKHEESGKEGSASIDVYSREDYLKLLTHWNGYKQRFMIRFHTWYYWPSETPAQKIEEKKDWSFLEEAGVNYHQRSWFLREE